MTQNDMKCNFESFLGGENFLGGGFNTPDAPCILFKLQKTILENFDDICKNNWNTLKGGSIFINNTNLPMTLAFLYCTYILYMYAKYSNKKLRILFESYRKFYMLYWPHDLTELKTKSRHELLEVYTSKLV